MSLVSQEPVLFSSTIRDNIAYGLNHVTYHDVIGAAVKANAHEFVGTLPHGYDTMAGERGLMLSGF